MRLGWHSGGEDRGAIIGGDKGRFGQSALYIYICMKLSNNKSKYSKRIYHLI